MSTATAPAPAGRARADLFARDEVLFALAVLVSYLVSAVWAREFSLPGPILIWFPPAGVAIVALYLRPRLLPLIVVAEVFSTAVIMDLGDEFGVGPLLVNSIVIPGAYAVAAWVMRQWRRNLTLRAAEDVIVLLVGTAVGSLLAAIAGVLVQVWTELLEWSDFGKEVGIFWIGDVVGAVCLAPALLLAARAYLRHEPLPISDHDTPGPWYLLAVEYLTPAVLAVVVMEVGQAPMRFTYLAFIPVVFIAVRHGIPGAALSTGALCAVMTAGAQAQVAETLDRSDFQLQLLVLSITGVMLGAVVSARHRAARRVFQISQIVEASPQLVASVDGHGDVRYVNPAGRRIMGLGDTTPPSTKVADFLPDQLAMGLMEEGLRAAERNGTWMGENRLRRPDGRVIEVTQVLIVHPHDDTGVRYSTVCHDMTDRHRLESELRLAALYDEQTGLPNRALLLDQLARMIDQIEANRSVAVLFADIDHLDRVNETFGFTAGDHVVGAVATRLAGVVRGRDLVARYGGAQFVVAMPRVPDELEAMALADRVLACFHDPITVDDQEVQVTGSVGIAIAGKGSDRDSVLRSAEIALHRAHEAGGGRFAMFDRELEERAQRRRDLEGDLREVLASHSWELAFQPVVDTDSRRVVGVEALLRWDHPTRGPVSPYDLIRLAERSGAIVPLGLEVFTRACDQAGAWHRAGHDLSVAINVSGRQLREPGFVDEVGRAIDAAGIAPARVLVELTETVLATGEHGELTSLNRLRELGCLVALDDFGTGYSSLSGLRDLPIDVVKLDQSFISDLDTSRQAVAMVDAVVRLANALDLVVVAEGVETEKQLATLQRLGCHRFQGFAFSRPLSPDAVTRLLDRPG